MAHTAKYTDVAGAAEILACSATTIRRMIDLGSLRAIKLSPHDRGGVRIPLADLDALCDGTARRVAAAASATRRSAADAQSA